MSDTIAVMNNGKILQIGEPIDIYNEPKNAFVASFIGESNIIDGTMLEDKIVRFSGTVFKCVDTGFNKSEDVDVVVRPEDIEITSEIDGALAGTVVNVIFKGVHYEMIVRDDITEYVWKIHSTVMSPVGKKVGMNIAPDLIHIMKKQYIHTEDGNE
jgi:spermidine/putrescine transport system ATP-binding protein